MIFLTIFAVALLAALAYQQFAHNRQTANREKEWALERGAMHTERVHERKAIAEEFAAYREAADLKESELLTRIQHPNILIRPMQQDSPDEEHPEPELDEIDLVGTIQSGNNSDQD